MIIMCQHEKRHIDKLKVPNFQIVTKCRHFFSVNSRLRFKFDFDCFFVFVEVFAKGVPVFGEAAVNSFIFNSQLQAMDKCVYAIVVDPQERKKKFNVVYLTNRFHVAVLLFSNRSQMTSKCGKNKKVAHEAQPSVSLMFLPHFDVICDLLLNRRTATWNLFVLYNKKIKIHGKNALLFQISPL